MAPEVVNPETTNVEARASPNVDIPALENPTVVVCPNVLIPVTVKSVKVFGAFTIAASIVAVVVASREAIFCSCLELLITTVPLTV